MIFIAICSCLLTLAGGKVNPDIEAGKSVDISVCVFVCASVWRLNSRGQINNVVLKTFLYSAKSLHRYFTTKHRAFLTSRFILFTY